MNQDNQRDAGTSTTSTSTPYPVLEMLAAAVAALDADDSPSAVGRTRKVHLECQARAAMNAVLDVYRPWVYQALNLTDWKAEIAWRDRSIEMWEKKYTDMSGEHLRAVRRIEYLTGRLRAAGLDTQ